MQSLVTPLGPHASTCGYCCDHSSDSPKSSYNVASLSALRLTCDVYQKMIDRGWRRSGTYCYKPDLRVSCCPQYTIRLDVLEFKASKSQRKVLNRWNRHVLEGNEPGMDIGEIARNKFSSQHGKPNKNHAFILETSIHSSEHTFLKGGQDSVHRFTVTLEPSSYTEEKYQLYQKYQKVIHADDSTPRGFESPEPLQRSSIPYPGATPGHLPSHYGAYHQLYRLDDKLIAMGVLDILPACVSSVYFMYDSDWNDFSLGKLSALREISLAKEMHDAGAPGMRYQYMGFYIHSCQKMKYKGEYAPSYLSDPVTYEWYPLSQCTSFLDKHRYACFSDPSQSTDKIPDDADHDVDEHVFTHSELEDVQAAMKITTSTIYVAPVRQTPQWEDEQDRKRFLCCIEGLSPSVAKDVIFLP